MLTCLYIFGEINPKMDHFSHFLAILNHIYVDLYKSGQMADYCLRCKLQNMMSGWAAIGMNTVQKTHMYNVPQKTRAKKNDKYGAVW